VSADRIAWRRHHNETFGNVVAVLTKGRLLSRFDDDSARVCYTDIGRHIVMTMLPITVFGGLSETARYAAIYSNGQMPERTAQNCHKAT
jgi:hypothetical protein